MELVHFSTSVPNFGDDLNLDIWPALAPRLFEPGDEDRGFVGIGTIFGMPRVRQTRLEVFSTGAGNDPVDGWNDRELTIHCVRGPVTARALGLEPASAVTDGAILTPLVPGFPERASSGGGVLVAPHFQTIEHGGWQEACALAGFRLLDPRQATQDAVRAIAGADLVLTESLHGAILADTYGIPWKAFMTSGNFGLAKWIDWTASLELDCTITSVPPPTIEPLIRYGRPRGRFGAASNFTVEEALHHFQKRLQPPSSARSTMRRRLRDALISLPAVRALANFNSARTAQSLQSLARRDGQMSRGSLRRSLTDQLLTKLHAVATL